MVFLFYMCQPPGFDNSQFPHHICKLKKAIYGRKQAPRAWFHRFSRFLLTHGFTCSPSDTSTFVYHHGSTTVILLLYVDDIILTGSSSTILHNFISVLSRQFAMKDLGDLHNFMGVQVTRTSTGIFLT